MNDLLILFFLIGIVVIAAGVAIISVVGYAVMSANQPQKNEVTTEIQINEYKAPETPPIPVEKPAEIKETTIRQPSISVVVRSSVRNSARLPPCTRELVEARIPCEYSKDGVGRVCNPSGESCGSFLPCSD